MTTQPFANLGKTGHNKADELNDTTDLTTKGARLDAKVDRDGKSHNRW